MTDQPHTTADSLDALSDEIRQLRVDLADTRAELRDQTSEARKQTMNTRIAIGLVFVLLACTIAGAFQVSLANSRAIQSNNMRWCPLLLSIGPRPGAPLPAGDKQQQEYAIQTRALIRDLSHQYGCIK